MSLELSLCACFLVIPQINYVFTQNSRKIPDEITWHRNWKLLNTSGVCGHSKDGQRVVGGKAASLGQYPWMARLGYSGGDYGEDYLCGGTVINNRYILTAAHCGPEFQEEDLLVVRLGELIHKDEVEPTTNCVGNMCAPPVQDYDVEEIYCHPNYESTIRKDDICLIRVNRKIDFNDYVAPICLPFHEYLLESTYAKKSTHVAGWGFVNSDNQNPISSDILQTLAIPIYDQEACASLFATLRFSVGKNQLCAGGQLGKDSCGGDSGGPLMEKKVLGFNVLHFQIGIVSFGIRDCATKSVPGVYTRVDKYLMWILDHIRE